MPSPRRILVPFDHSALATDALDYATTLARRLGARVMVFQALHPDDSKVHADGVLEEEIMRRRARGPLEIVHEERWGDPAAEIVRIAAEIEADLVVMGTHGRTGLARMFMGSVAEAVLRTSTCPVLTLRHRPLDQTPRHMLVATDFGEAARMALAFAVDLAADLGGTNTMGAGAPQSPPGFRSSLDGPSGASITVANVFATPLPLMAAQTSFVSAEVFDDEIISSSEALGRCVAKLRARGVPIGTILREGEAQRVIGELATEIGADLIVLGTHGREGLSRALHGSVAEQILRDAPVPVVTVRTAR
jgi:nucleotide-binding universal stress UspA family protein